MLNQVACKAMHFYKIIWQYLWMLKPEDLFDGENAFVVDGHFFFQQLLDTVIYLPHGASGDLEETILNESADTKKFIIKAIEMLTIFCTENEFKPYFLDDQQGRFLQLIVPYLKVTEAEKETLETDPTEFCNLIDDVCGDQKSSTVKTNIARLLDKLCSKVPNFFRSTMTFCMDAISRSLKDHVPTNLSFTANSADEQMGT